jgi:hypothetical protein
LEMGPMGLIGPIGRNGQQDKDLARGFPLTPCPSAPRPPGHSRLRITHYALLPLGGFTAQSLLLILRPAFSVEFFNENGPGDPRTGNSWLPGVFFLNALSAARHARLPGPQPRRGRP